MASYTKNEFYNHFLAETIATSFKTHIIWYYRITTITKFKIYLKKVPIIANNTIA